MNSAQQIDANGAVRRDHASGIAAGDCAEGHEAIDAGVRGEGKRR